MQETFALKAALLDPTRTKTIGNYVIGKTLGKGTFGKVKAATHVPTGQKVAVKILQKEKIIDVADVERVSREIHILKLIRHPSIIQLYEIIETPKQLFLIMEYMECGQLFDYIVKCKKIPQEEACTIFQQIVGGIEYIHRLNIVHRDLKPQNLLIDYDRTIRIVDFGLSNTYRKGTLIPNADERLKTACGSPCYAAPQMIEGKVKYQALMVDIWSCGVILYAMLCGCLPFQDQQTSKLYQKILGGEYKVPKTLSEEAKDILSKILTVDPNKRFRIEDIQRHRWWHLSSNRNSSQGIVVGHHRIPVDKAILTQLNSLGFEEDFAKKCIEANRHNDATTTYYLLLKKHIREGGMSKAYLGSKHFDHTLIQPLRKTIPSSMFETTTPLFSPKNTDQRNITSQTGIPRRNYHLQKNNSAQKDDTKYRQLYTHAHRTAFKPTKIRPDRQNRTLEKSTLASQRQPNQTIGYDLRQDAIRKKYQESYGVSLVSKSKDKPQTRRKSLRKYQLFEIYEKPLMNQTMMAYGRNKTKSNKIGMDRGFEENINTIDVARKPYVNRRFVYH